jgi:hypothetical protein
MQESEEEFLAAVEVVAGNPTPEELAAVIAVIKEARKQEKRAVSTPRSSWAKNPEMLRGQLVIGNGQWGSSFKAGL